MSVKNSSNLFKGTEFDELIRCNQKLQELGINATITLPRIVVVGDQSSGKSSLIEALSSIEVPRAASCCTRCPLAINLAPGQQAAEWECKIFIEKRYEYNKSDTSSSDTARYLDPWKPCQPVSHLYETTQASDKLCEIIKAAQNAVLTPDTSIKSKALKFSPNLVRLDISSATYPTISFIDLPGIIASSEEASEAYLVPLVDKLVKTYAIDQDTILLLVLPMTNDLANSKARTIIQDLDAEDRTLTVLTKPDRAQRDGHEQYLEKFLEHDDPVFGHGYRIVMMGSKTSEEDAESLFFSSTEPWMSLAKEYRSRLGVQSLRTYLQQLLFRKIRQSLPANIQHIEVRLQAIETQLAQLPAATDLSGLPLLFERIMAALSDRLRRAFIGGTGTNHVLLEQWSTISGSLHERITTSYPTLNLRSRDDDRILVANTNSKKSTGNVINKPGTPSEAIEIQDVDDSLAKTMPSTRRELEKSTPGRITTETAICHFKLDQIRNINQKYAMFGFPAQACPLALKEMTMMSVAGWDWPLNQFMSSISRLIHVEVIDIVDGAFKDLMTLAIFEAVTNWVKGYLDKVIQEEWTRAEDVLTMEKTTPYAGDVEQHTANYQDNLADTISKRNIVRVKALQASEGGKSKKRIAEQMLPVDDFKIEIEMAAHVRAYYDIAAYRFTDVVCQGIVGRLFPLCCEQLVGELRDYIGVDRPAQQAQLQEWMCPNPETEKQRRDLLSERERLIAGKEYITKALGANFEARVLATPGPEHAFSITNSTPTSTSSKRSLPQEFETPSKTKRSAGPFTLSIRASPERYNGKAKAKTAGAEASTFL